MAEDPSPPSPDLTEEQKNRVESNRLRALAKRKAALDHHQNHLQPQPGTANTVGRNPCWRLFKCHKNPFPSVSSKPPTFQQNHLQNPECVGTRKLFRVKLEICSPDSFSVSPDLGCLYSGEDEWFGKLEDCLSEVMSTHYTQIHDGGKASVYKIRDYDMVLKCLKNSKYFEVEEIPWTTYNVVEKLSHSYVAGQWIPCRPEHLPDEKVEELIRNLPRKLLNALLPFQLDGLRFGLRRGGRCLIADEMGLGKTLQAIALASCFAHEGSILVVCPAILRFSWAEELERWLPHYLPGDIHLVFGRQNNPAHLEKCPKIVIISYTMLGRLRESMLKLDWAVLIVDESHHIRCSKKKSEPREVQAVLDLTSKVGALGRIILLSGTPSLSRNGFIALTLERMLGADRPFDIYHQINILWPGLLGKSKFEFAKTYCSVKIVQDSQGNVFKDFSRGSRLEELNVLLRQSVMIRRLKEHLLLQLPPKRRQIIRLLLKRSDIIAAKSDVRTEGHSLTTNDACGDNPSKISDETDESGGSRSPEELSDQVLGIAKVSGFLEWLSLHPIITEADDSSDPELGVSFQKMIIFAHHHKVFDKVQEFICGKGIGFIRIDGNTLDCDRQSGVKSFQSSREVKIAMIGIKVGYAGLDLSAAQNVVFLELPKEPTSLLQAEDRAHRKGQTNAVNVYIFCAKGTSDESCWRRLNKSLQRVSSTTDGKYDAIKEIEVESVSYIGNFGNSGSSRFGNSDSNVESCEEHPEDHEREQNNVHHVMDAEADEEFLLTQAPSDDSKAEEMLQAGGSFQAESLCFSVSQYTGRIHLCTCVPGAKSNPSPLSENFRPDEITAECDYRRASTFMRENPTCWRALITFIAEWESLKRIDKKKLLGKPLRLPVIKELLHFNESKFHDSNGLLKGGSRRRNTPLSQLSVPLPSTAVWKEVSLCGGNAKKKRAYKQGWTLTDEPLCMLCQNPCKGINAKKPEALDDLFCSLACYEDYRSRTSNRFLRQELFQIEYGVCSNCQLDCHKLVEHLKPLTHASREQYIKKQAPNLAKRKKLLDKLVYDPTEGNAWHADHKVAVYKGGGECRLENMRTLCVACHTDVTAAQHAERVLARKQLKNAMAMFGKNRKKRRKCAELLDQGGPSMEEKADDDELLVDVPGSGYCEAKLVATGREEPETSLKNE